MSGQTVHCIQSQQLRLLQVWLQAFWNVQCASYISAANVKLPWGTESNILPHLHWWCNHFLKTAEEYLHFSWVVFDWFREHNLKLKPLKCNLFREEISYLMHQVSKEGVQPSNLNLTAIAECVPPQTYMEVHVFLGLVGHCRRFIKGFTCIAQSVSKHLAGEGTSRKSEQVLLSEDTSKAFEALKQVFMTAPILDFTDGLGAVLSQKQTDGQYYPVTYGSREPLCLTRRTTTQLSSGF